VLGGVCAGIAKTYGIDITLVRVLAVVAGVMWIGIPAYLIAWIAIPADDGSTAITDQPRDFGMIAGLALIGIGALIAIDHILPSFGGGHFFGPFLLIAGGIAILVLRRPVDPDSIAEEAPAPEPEDAIAPDPWSAAVTASNPTEELHDAEPAGAERVDAEPHTAWTQTAPWPYMRDARAELRAEKWSHNWHDHHYWRTEARRIKQEARDRRRDRRRQKPRPFIGPLTFSMLLIGAGIVSLLQATDVVDVNLTIALAVATAFVGVMLTITAWVGRARGLIALGLVLAFATSVSTVLDVPLSGGIGEQTYRPITVAELDSAYEHGIGQLTVDLSDLKFAAGSTTELDVQLGIGELRVFAPQNTIVEIDAEAGAGEIELFGQTDDGMHVDEHRIWVSPTGNSTATLVLDLRVGAGHIEVTP
jgi:phage shock protein PspC (stress-responsive transcriptional regulator)/predicted membrane protein